MSGAVLGPGVQQLDCQFPAMTPPSPNFSNFPFRGCRPFAAALAFRALTKGSRASPSLPQLNCPPLREIFPGSPRAWDDSGRYKRPVSALSPGPAADCQSLPWGLEEQRGALVDPQRRSAAAHSPDLGTCGGIVLAMRVHRTMCNGHRPRSSPRPMVAPVARHRPAPEAP